MEVYILDSLLRRDQVVDKFESLIWTERFTASGDFTLLLNSTLENRSRFTPGVRLAMNRSRRVMTVETSEDTVTDDGKTVLKVTGNSLEKILEDRVIKNSWADLTIEPAMVIVDTPGNVARRMFDHICRDLALDPGDGIPFLMPGSIMPNSTILENSTIINHEQPPARLYDAIKAVVEMYDLGFRLIRNFDMSQLYFDVYSGNDRTTRQRVFAPVVFAPDLDNLQNVTEFNTIEKYKNVAYVFSKLGVEIVYPEDVDPEVEGFERRVLLVNAADIREDTVDIPTMLRHKGLEELAKTRSYSAYDGELNRNGRYNYGTDYELGDLVEMRNKDGVVTIRRVTEQIFADDASGERSYPTLSANLFINPGSWMAWNNTQVWEDFTTEFWADM